MAGNLALMSLWHARRVFARSRIPNFIHITLNETTQKLCSQFHNMHKAMGSTSTPIDFTVGVDATVVVKSCQILQSHGDIVGGAYPNKILDINNNSDKETVALIKECVDVKNGLQSDDVKVAVISMQVVHQGLSPYFTLVGRPHTINEINIFGEFVIQTYMEAASSL